MTLPLQPPLAPELALTRKELPEGEDYVYELTGSSLQSAEQVELTARALGIAEVNALLGRIRGLRPLFVARNEVSHELDLQRPDQAGVRTRRSRALGATTALCADGLEVAQLMPGKTITMNGALGPLSTLAATGAMQIQLMADGNSTNLVVTYAVAGYMAKGMNTWAAPVDGVIAEQFTRLKAFVEKGVVEKSAR